MKKRKYVSLKTACAGLIVGIAVGATADNYIRQNVDKINETVETVQWHVENYRIKKDVASMPGKDFGQMISELECTTISPVSGRRLELRLKDISYMGSPDGKNCEVTVDERHRPFGRDFQNIEMFVARNMVVDYVREYRAKAHRKV